MMKEREVTHSMVDFKSQIRTTDNLYVSSKTGENVTLGFENLISLYVKNKRRITMQKSELIENNCYCY